MHTVSVFLFQMLKSYAKCYCFYHSHGFIPLANICYSFNGQLHIYIMLTFILFSEQWYLLSTEVYYCCLI